MKKPNPNRNLTIREAAEQLHVASVTIHNWIKEGLLVMDEDKKVTSQSIRRFRLRYAGKSRLRSRANKSQKDSFDAAEASRWVRSELETDPEGEVLSHSYEMLLAESFRNREGIFYTPLSIVDDMLKGLEINEKTLFLDPCCGSGNFLVKAIEHGVLPENVYGFDTDPNAVEIARYRIKQLTGRDPLHLVCGDFLQESQHLEVRFDLVFTNPPWGKKISKKERDFYVSRFHCGSSDTCSLFLFAILQVLRPEGLAGLLMPESFFNIAAFEDARRAVLQQTLLKMKDYGKPFKNTYSACSLVFRHHPSEGGSLVECVKEQRSYLRSHQSFEAMPKHILNYWTTDREMVYLEQLLRQPYLTLKGYAIWGMGIVTGNNTKICKHSRRAGWKPIFRGKDILPGKLKHSGLYIDPEDFPRCQQVPSLELLQSPEKLIYRFISKRLVFFCDTKQRYILNSANLLVLDDGFPLTSNQLAELMNSPLTNWLFQQIFHTHKVLRGDLELLPIFTDSALHRRFDLLDFNG